MGWMITLGILVLLAVLPLGVSVHYDVSGPCVRLIAGPVKITLFPRKKKPAAKAKPDPKQKLPQQEPQKKEPQEQEIQKQEPQEPEAQKQEPQKQADKPLPQPPQPPKEKKADGETAKGGSLADFLPLVKLVFQFLGDFRRKLRLNNLQLKLTLAGGDPCDLAVNYGKTWAAVGNLIPLLDSWFVIGKRNIEVACDFVAPETLVFAHLDLTITLGRLICLVVVYGLRALIEYLNLKKKRKGGAVT